MLGLWPFHAPINDVSWLGNRNGLHFGRFSTAFCSSEFRMMAAPNGTSASLEIWLQPDRMWDFSTFLTFYIPGNPLQFSLHQAQTSLLLRTAFKDDQHHSEMLYVEHVFRKNAPAFITLTSGPPGTTVYI